MVPLQHLQDALALAQSLAPPQGRSLRLQHRNATVHTGVQLLLDGIGIGTSLLAVAVAAASVLRCCCCSPLAMLLLAPHLPCCRCLCRLFVILERP